MVGPGFEPRGAEWSYPLDYWDLSELKWLLTLKF